MNSKKRAFLKKLAHSIDPIVRIGKDGITENLIKSIDEAIDSRELIKVKILQNCEIDKKEIYARFIEMRNFEVVDIIGRIIILFKENKEKPKISLELKKF